MVENGAEIRVTCDNRYVQPVAVNVVDYVMSQSIAGMGQINSYPPTIDVIEKDFPIGLEACVCVVSTAEPILAGQIRVVETIVDQFVL